MTLRVPHLALLLLATVAAAACGSPAPPVTGEPAPAARVPARADSLAGPWTLRPAPGEREHTVLLSAVLTSRLDTVERTDTLRARLQARGSLVVGGGADRIAGLLGAYEVSSGDSVPFAPPPGLSVPLAFAATLGPRGEAPRLVIPPGSECSPVAAAIQPLRDLWVRAPERLAVGDTWVDSLEYPLCRDSIPLTVRTERHYRVMGAEVFAGAVALRVVRDSRTTLTGEGLQFGEAIRLEAEGGGRMEYLLSPLGGEVLCGIGEASLDLQMTSRRRSQALRQVTRIEIGSP